MNKEQFFRDLDRLRGSTFTDKEIKKIIDVLGPIFICNRLAISIEPTRIWRIYCYEPDETSCISEYATRPRELTESEAVKWWYEYTPEYNMKKGHLHYKKDGEWVIYKPIYEP